MTTSVQEASTAQRVAGQEQIESYWRDRPAWKESTIGRVIVTISHDIPAIIGLAWFLVLLVVAIVGPWLQLDVESLDIGNALAPPSLQHLAGTDDLGRDIFVRLVVAARVSVLGSMVAVLVGTIIGVSWGLTAGFSKGTVDSIMMRVVDFMLSIPSILLAMMILAVLGAGAMNALIAVAVTRIPTMARLARSGTIVEQEKDYVLASRSLGARSPHLMFNVIMPNALPPVLVQFTLSLAFAVLLESGLSFLGLGTQPPTPAWGYMLADGRRYLRDAPWMGLIPGLVITSYVMAIGTLSDGLRAAIGARTVRG